MMSDQPNPAKPGTVKPDHLVIERPTTAQDMFLMAVRGNPANLATAASVPEGENYILSINIQLHFTREDTLAMLRAGGFDVSFPSAANDAEKKQ
jgi:hypothetical protein